ncbi:MAG: UDP binding domain-containing protein, partial [Aggregatilineales bacterium]
DPHYLSWKLQTLGYNARFIKLASEVNTGMPRYIVNKIMNALNDDAKPMRGSRVLVLGVAYKPDIDDVRESPALDVIALLQKRGADVCYHDPLVGEIQLEGGVKMTCTPLSEKLLQNVDCVVITTHHSSYDWAMVLKHSHLVMDTRHVTPGYDSDTRVVLL